METVGAGLHPPCMVLCHLTYTPLTSCQSGDRTNTPGSSCLHQRFPFLEQNSTFKPPEASKLQTGSFVFLSFLIPEDR